MKVAILLSLLSLGLAGFLAYDRFGGCSSCRGGACDSTPATSSVEEEVKDLKARLAALENKPERVEPTLGRTTSGLAAGSNPAGNSAPATTELAEISKRLASLEEYKAKSEEEARTRPQLPRGVRLGKNGFGGAGLYLSVDDAKADLALTDQQKGDFDRIVADAKRELDEVWKTPDEDGKTYEQVMGDMLKPGANGQPTFDISKILSYRNKTIPGRSETYGAADKRIRDGGKAAMRNTLSAEQQTKFDKSTPDAMFGSPGLGSTMMTTFAQPIGR